MYNNMETGRTKRWDMILLIFLILAFVLFTSSTVYLVKERGEQTIKLRANLSDKSLKLAELDSTINKLITGNSASISKLNQQNQALNSNTNISDDKAWSTLTSNANALWRLANNDEIKATFFDKENTIASLGKLAKQAFDLADANAYQHPVIDKYLNANATMDLVGNLLYSGDADYVKNAFQRIHNSTSDKETVYSYIQNFDDVLEVYNSATILDMLQNSEQRIIDLVSGASNLKRNISNLQNTVNLEASNSSAQTSTITTFLGDIPSYIIYITLAIAVITLIISIIIISKIISDRSRSERANALQNQKNEEAIFEMLDVIYSLSEGDLTVQAKVTDHFTGTLADSFNMSVEELRELVKAVGNSSERVAGAVKTAIGYADEFTEASLSQAMQITDATNIVSHVTKAMLDVSTQTSAAVDIAMSSTEVARSGSERVRSTITGMDQIRDHIQETSKRIKRLGESSQEIGDVVELINDIADQTHILALNAAIQASAAGEAGKGFAVVADEVQRLAERTGNATSRVEGLVKTIQSDTNEAIFAMEKSTSEVVNGANLAERAGESLNEIESVSGRLAGLIQSVSQASREVSELGSQVQTSMDSVKKLSETNVENTKTTKSSIVALEKLADELKESISGFKID